jgi:hypothetical protein
LKLRVLRAVDGYDGYDGNLTIGKLYIGEPVGELDGYTDKGYRVKWNVEKLKWNFIYAFRFEEVSSDNISKLERLIYNIE